MLTSRGEPDRELRVGDAGAARCGDGGELSVGSVFLAEKNGILVDIRR